MPPGAKVGGEADSTGAISIGDIQLQVLRQRVRSGDESDLRLVVDGASADGRYSEEGDHRRDDEHPIGAICG